MAFDPNLNNNDPGSSVLNSEDSLEFPDWCQNEESFDLTNFMSTSRNLELCNDELFENLFPSNSPPPPPSKHSDDAGQLDDPELERWCHTTINDPLSACASACSSTAASPTPQNYYNTPPVTPRAERYRAVSPHPLQFDNLTTSMAGSKMKSLWNEKPATTSHPVGEALDAQPILAHQLVAVKEEQSDNSFGFAKPGSAEVDNSTLISASANYHLPSNSSVAPKSDVIEPHSSKRVRPDAPHNSNKKTKLVEKGSAEYLEKRKRNNVAVRRSRDKAKKKAEETQKKVDELSNENAALRERVAELSHELNTLKNLLTSLPQTPTAVSKM